MIDPKDDERPPEERGVEVPLRRARRRAQAPSSGNKRGVFLAVGLVLGAGAIVAIVLTMMTGAIYSKTVDVLLANKGRFVNRPVRVEGSLVHGTLNHAKPCEYDFTIATKGVELPVRFAQCVVPDTFRDVPDMDVSVTVEGSLKADNTFEATSVLAKCPSKYEMKNRAARGEQMPHASLPNN
jgi:cytochrome c-type biogenesis protein CcmE